MKNCRFYNIERKKKSLIIASSFFCVGLTLNDRGAFFDHGKKLIIIIEIMDPQYAHTPAEKKLVYFPLKILNVPWKGHSALMAWIY